MIPRAHRHQTHRIERPIDPVHIALVQIEVVHQVVADLLRSGVVHLEAHRCTAPPVVQLLLDCAQEVAGVILVDVELAVARQAEMPVAQNLCSGKKVREVMANQVAQKNIVALLLGSGQPHKAGKHSRHLHHREPPACAPAPGRRRIPSTLASSFARALT